MDTFSRIIALYSDSKAVHLVIVGDFNCQYCSRLYDILCQLVENNDLVLSDCKGLRNIFTYCSDNGSNTSWIDHIACSSVVDSCIQIIEILYDLITLIISL